MGIKKVRFKKMVDTHQIDDSTYSLIRDPSKCVLCGDCVRVCDEIQGVGAIDFAFRGSKCEILPSFGKDLAKSECVNCGQCVKSCPTGALLVKPEIENVWADLANPKKRVIATIAPSVRVAIGEEFGLQPGESSTGQMVASLKLMGFDEVYDTSFAADLTIVEEASEFLTRFTSGGRLPMFTSCCPAWVKFAEQYYPDYTPNLSTCRSPQGMFSSLLKTVLPAKYGINREDLIIVSIMPCTAKKFEARREELGVDGNLDSDHILTTIELARMIKEAGIDFNAIEPVSFDMPYGFKTGGGVIFGVTGGVTEAVLRFASEKISGKVDSNYEFFDVRGETGIKEVDITIEGTTIKLCVAHGLRNAEKVMESIIAGTAKYDMIEIMACPGGCINGGGQPCQPHDVPDIKKRRSDGLYKNDKMLQLHKPQENPHIKELYENGIFKDPHVAHEKLHTHFRMRKRLETEGITISKADADKALLDVEICFGTGCYIRGAQDLMKQVVDGLDAKGFKDKIDVKAAFCFENCDKGPSVKVGGELIIGADAEKVLKKVSEKLK
jgi:NADH-quinone oxidoreductase subunit G